MMWSHEKSYLAELMQEFPTYPYRSVDEAYLIVQERYKQLVPERFSKRLQSLNEEQFVAFVSQLPRQIHKYMYSDILANAGIYRQGSDYNGGVVYFGLNQKFTGGSPATLEESVIEACSQLSRTTTHPVKSAAAFYQRFVQIHPFYDANGRIGRFIAKSYLDMYGLHMYWERMRQNTRWLHKLNALHPRYGAWGYDTYLDRFAAHWMKFIVPKDDILLMSEHGDSAENAPP